MKRVTAREFYHKAGLVDGLVDGQDLVVTSKGEPKFVVTRSAPPRMTPALAEGRAVGDARKPKVDGTGFLRTLK